MHLLFKITLLVCLSLSVIACKKETPKGEQQYKSVMAIHDSVMPRMGELMSLRKQLQETQTPQNKDTVAALMTKMELANKGMMDWMYQFKKPEDLESETALQYLNQEKLKIQQVKADIEGGINEAKQRLK